MQFIHRSMVKIHRQQGAVLFITLIMLVLLIVIGFNALSTSDVQSRLVGNAQFQNTAKQRAENALAEAERWITQVANAKNTGFDTRSASSPPELYPLDYLKNNNIDPLMMTWSDSNSSKVTISEQRYIIESLSPTITASGSGIGSSRNATGAAANACNQLRLFRITTRGESARSATQFIQVIYSACI